MLPVKNLRPPNTQNNKMGNICQVQNLKLAIFPIATTKEGSQPF